MDGTSDVFLIALWFVLFGFVLGSIVALLIRALLLRAESFAQAHVSKHLSYTGDIRCAIGALQQLQTMIGREAAERDPSLADLVRLLRSMQHEYGHHASLEGVIQALVAQDIDLQLVQRRSQRLRAKLAVGMGPTKKEVLA